MRFQLILFTVTALITGLLAACGGAANTNTNVTNMGANNANVGAIVVNNNTANTNRWSNTNITREEYDRNRAEYERDKGSSTIGAGANDSWLWFKTRAAMLTTSDLRESTIDVDVVNDVVTLKGTVETAAQKTKAEQVAKDIDGVKSVKNELKVDPDDSATNMSTGNSGNMNKR
jgi:hyperosmotically inducible protein